MRNCSINPEVIGRSNWCPQRCCAPSVDKPRNRLPIDAQRNRLAKFDFSKPSLFSRTFGRLSLRNRVQIKKQKIEFEAWTKIVEMKRAGILLSLQNRIIFSAYPIDDICISSLKPNDFRIRIRNKQKGNLIQVRKPLPLVINFPVKRIAFESNPLSGNIFLEPKGSKTRDLLRRSPQAPSLREFSVFVGVFQQMFGQNGQAIKQPLGSRIRLRQFENYLIGINPLDSDRLALNHQQVALRRMDTVVEIHFEGKDHIISVDRMTVGKMQAATDLQSVTKSVRRYTPRLRQSRLGLLREPVDVYQITGHLRDNF